MTRTKENYVYVGLGALALLLFSLMNYIKGGGFDFDETFSLAMIDHSFSEIWAITARDYHPPLSYFILKVLSWFVKPFAEGNLALYRLTAILGYFTIILLCIFPIRRLWGFRVSVIAILLFIFTPISFYIYSNFRMYAWTTPLVLATFVYAYDALRSNSHWAWLKLVLVASAAMYIHYYSLISTFVIFVLLFIVILLDEKENAKGLLKSYFVSGFALMLLYAPWLYFFVGQLAEVKSDYWIGNPAMSDFVFAIQYYFVPKYYTEKYTTLLSSTWLLAIIPLLLLLVPTIIVLAYSNLRNKMKHHRAEIYVSIFALLALSISLGLVLFYTFAVSPVYHIRYLMCYFGLFVLALAICIDILLERKKRLGRIVVLVFSILLLFDFCLCFYFNIKRSNFSMERIWVTAEEEAIKESYYATEDSFTDMAYLTVLHPKNSYYLITDDNPHTRLVSPPYIENDTITGMPFSNFMKVKSLDVNHPFLYLTKENPQNDTVFSMRYQVVDSLYTGLYRVEPIK